MDRNLTFRRATIEDTGAIAKISAETFEAAFGPQNTPEDMEAYLATNFNLDAIQTQIMDESSTFLLEYEGEKLIGYAMLKAGTPPVPVSDLEAIELVRFYVAEEVIGMGYGSALMQACLDEARALGYSTMWLGVWMVNMRAIRFYEKWGFKKIGTRQFVLGQDVQDDWVMEVDL